VAICLQGFFVEAAFSLFSRKSLCSVTRGLALDCLRSVGVMRTLDQSVGDVS
jgi:hypothetical protein